MTRIGILETGKNAQVMRDVYGDCPTLLRTYFAGQKGMEFAVHNIAGGDPMPDPKVCDAWVLPGSPAGVYETEKYPWMSPALDFARKLVDSSIPTVGICFGHQLLAQANGGEVRQSEKGRGMGVHEYALTDAGRKFVSGNTTLSLVVLHQDQVVDPPPGAKLLASSPFCNFAAFSYGDSAISFQGHPELSVGYARKAIEEWQKVKPVAGEVLEAARETVRRVRPDPMTDFTPDARSILPVLRNFLLRDAAL